MNIELRFILALLMERLKYVNLFSQTQLSMIMRGMTKEIASYQPAKILCMAQDSRRLKPTGFHGDLTTRLSKAITKL